jgi:hypothetical protein
MLRYISDVAIAVHRENSQDEHAEPNTSGTSSSSNGNNVHNEDSAPEPCLKTVHCKEGAWLQRIAEEEDDSEDIDQ